MKEEKGEAGGSNFLSHRKTAKGGHPSAGTVERLRGHHGIAEEDRDLLALLPIRRVRKVQRKR